MNDLINHAYSIGKSRGTSLDSGYFISPCKTTVFCQNPNNQSGVLVTANGYLGFSSTMPVGYSRLDMSKQLAI